MKKNRAELTCALRLPTAQWERRMPRASTLREGTYYGGAGHLCGVASLGVLPGASIVYIEILGPQETPKWRRGDEGSQQRELHVQVWRGDEWLVGEHERMHVDAAKTFLGSESKSE